MSLKDDELKFLACQYQDLCDIIGPTKSKETVWAKLQIEALIEAKLTNEEIRYISDQIAEYIDQIIGEKI